MQDHHSALRAYRRAQRLTLSECAIRLGVHKTTLSRIETGELPTDADMVERIIALTGSAVSAGDMHAVRLAWLRDNRPEKFAPPARLEAAR